MTIPAQPGLQGSLTVPGDKSISHRAIIFGSLATGPTTIHNFLDSADCNSTIAAFQAMGVPIRKAGQTVTVTGVGLLGLQAPKQPLDFGNSGTTTRLLTGLLSGQSFVSQISGDASLSKRPMGRVIDPLTTMGADIESRAGQLPLTIHGRPLHGFAYELPVASAQVKSALILAALTASGQTTIREKTPSRDHSERMLAAFSPASIDVADQQITIHPGQSLQGQNLTVPGDISSAAFWLVAAAIVPNSQITVHNVGLNPSRTGLLRVLERAGADMTLTNVSQAAEPAADITIRTSQLRPFAIEAAEIPSLVDEIPILALLAAAAPGRSTISGAEELRLKESDRLHAISTEFNKLGIELQEKADGLVIDGGRPFTQPTQPLNSYQDHRIAMTLRIASLVLAAPVTIQDFDCINISYPSFADDLAKVSRR
ncbi:3-phosphoshikimate 1-carboxyvinyltransferase [Leuconostocaceae bacterium ESL0958]|nr:3-phosphoshikimate 1-carboxyvinyltransferase [Leuconostocaceae bacterium ESL0958]